MEFECRDGMVRPKAPRFGGYADSAGWCALYARLSSNYLILGEEEDKNQDLWVPANVWDFSLHNNVFWDTRVNGEHNCRFLPRGYILGIKLPFNEGEEKLKDRHKFDFNYMACYVKNFTINAKIGPWIFHNYKGDVRSESLISFLNETGGSLIQIFKPSEKK
ncbi:MAG: hypothetical protein Q7S27_04450 [Nanoarchaeota archaeon]|nr:hypothetical protein [Nanoarchaeota archaeon]